MNLIEPTLATKWTRLVGVHHPVLQDGMGGGVLGTGRLAAAVSNTGALGSLSTPGLSEDPVVLRRAMRAQVELVLSQTDRPVAVNCPVGTTVEGGERPGAKVVLDVIFEIRRSDPAAERQLRVLTTSAGLPSPDLVKRAHDEGMVHQHKVGAPRHAEKAVANGVDAIIASGHEMGGHTLKTPISTMVLAPEVLCRVDVPVVVSGGLKDGAGLAAVLAMGAAAGGMGTRFLTSVENDWHERYIDQVVKSSVEDSILMPGVYGPCRYLKGKATDELTRLIEDGALTEVELMDWKAERARIAQRDGEVENGLTAAGMVAGFIDERLPTRTIIERMVAEAGQLMSNATSLLVSKTGGTFSTTEAQ
ncbi:nitronate monooxygenase [Aeromicrobium sp. YIM 150415]|uniref:NAD(P)H-dependent flavin oxidoreductase n=1 Tax=Aeromicrobium sp. YIM 150415 TaxID=2803912 RepID=UPI0019663B68|nr:nitronate monooxygenase [Aeromicrobium sp. YIM 150415]MBM9463565.1 nitronate monooxygenase [Aeromicrobium sp. YIM 150415]